MLYLLPSPLGNLSDISLRTLEVLKSIEVFLCEDTRMTQKLLLLLEQKGYLAPSQTQRKFISFHTHNQEEFFKNIQQDFFNQNVAFLSDAGMPCVSDPGSLLVCYAQQNKIPYEVLGGGSASTLAYAYSGFGDSGFVFDSFLPHKSAQRVQRLCFWQEVLSQRGIPLVCFESPHRILESLEDIAKLECEVFAIKEISKKFEKFYKGRSEEVLEILREENTQGEWCLVIKFDTKEEGKKLGEVEILSLDLPPKIKAKLLSEVTSIPSKQWYERLIGKEER